MILSGRPELEFGVFIVNLGVSPHASTSVEQVTTCFTTWTNGIDVFFSSHQQFNVEILYVKRQHLIEILPSLVVLNMFWGNMFQDRCEFIMQLWDRFSR